MKLIHPYKTVLLTTIVLFFTLKINAQKKPVTSANTKLEKVLQERKRLLKGGYIKSYYTIQVFSGDIKNAKKVLSECKNEFEDASQIFYETPNYKVQIGKYRNRLDADRALTNIQEKYPSAFVFEPKAKK